MRSLSTFKLPGKGGIFRGLVAFLTSASADQMELDTSAGIVIASALTRRTVSGLAVSLADSRG